MQNKVVVVGGDKRFEHLKILLSKDFSVLMPFKSDGTIRPEIIEESDIVILPYPYTFDNIHINTPTTNVPILISDVTDLLRFDQTLFVGGNISINTTCSCGRIINYAADEKLLRGNAVLTAEGLLKIAIEEMHISIIGANFAITGFGRVGKATAKLLKNIGGNVSVFARKESDIELANNNGYSAHDYNDFTLYAGSYDCIINTVPSEVLTSFRLAALKQNCLLIDAASSPYGIDFSAADKYKLKTIIAGSLPGKTSPITAAEIIYETIGELI